MRRNLPLAGRSAQIPEITLENSHDHGSYDIFLERIAMNSEKWIAYWATVEFHRTYLLKDGPFFEMIRYERSGVRSSLRTG
jgi:hypothetical protein